MSPSFGMEGWESAEQMYITSGTLESSLCGFCPFCCWPLCFFCVRQSHSLNHKDLHLATVSWPPPQHGESPPATMRYIHCCSTLISCALVHLNATLKHHQIHFRNSSKYLISTSVPLNVSQIVPQCFFYIFVRPSTSECNLSRSMQRLSPGLLDYSPRCGWSAICGRLGPSEVYLFLQAPQRWMTNGSHWIQSSFQCWQPLDWQVKRGEILQYCSV